MARKKQEDPTKKTVCVISPPVSPSKFILLVTRGGGLMGASTAMFAVDNMIVEVDPSGKAVAVRGFLQPEPHSPRELVVEIPSGTSYLLVRRSDTRMLTPQEYAIEQQTEDKEMAAILAPAGPSVAAEAMEAVAADPGQYL